MNKKSRKNKKAKDSKRRKLSVQQQGNQADRTPYRHKNEIAPPHKVDQTYKTPPPKFGEQILYFVLPREVSENEIGDLAEHYQKLQPKLGINGARIWYYKEVGILLLRQFPGVIKEAFYASVGELFRGHIK